MNLKRAIAVSGAILCLGLASAPIAFAKPNPSAEKKGDAGKTGIDWEVSPKEVVVILDGKKLGEAGKLTFTAATPGKHGIKLMKGADETEMEVVVKKGETLKFTFSFDEG